MEAWLDPVQGEDLSLPGIEFVNLDCPVEVRQVSLLRTDVRSECCFRLFNLSYTVVKGIEMQLHCLNEAAQPVAEPPEHTLTGRLPISGIGPKSLYDVVVPLELLPETRYVICEIVRVEFVTGNAWEQGEEPLTPVEQDIISARDLNALRARAGKDAATFPREERNLWVCVCGRANRLHRPRCPRCLRTKQAVLEAFSRHVVAAAGDVPDPMHNHQERLRRRLLNLIAAPVPGITPPPEVIRKPENVAAERVAAVPPSRDVPATTPAEPMPVQEDAAAPLREETVPPERPLPGTPHVGPPPPPQRPRAVGTVASATGVAAAGVAIPSVPEVIPALPHLDPLPGTVGVERPAADQPGAAAPRGTAADWQQRLQELRGQAMQWVPDPEPDPQWDRVLPTDPAVAVADGLADPELTEVGRRRRAINDAIRRRVRGETEEEPELIRTGAGVVPQGAEDVAEPNAGLDGEIIVVDEEAEESLVEEEASLVEEAVEAVAEPDAGLDEEIIVVDEEAEESLVEEASLVEDAAAVAEPDAGLDEEIIVVDEEAEESLVEEEAGLVEDAGDVETETAVATDGRLPDGDGAAYTTRPEAMDSPAKPEQPTVGQRIWKWLFPPKQDKGGHHHSA